MAPSAKQPVAPSHGIDALIQKLRDEGVSAGRKQADSILAQAKQSAKQMVDKANEEARKHLEASRKEAAAFQSAGEAAIKTAMRDTMLEMKSRLMQRFSADVKRLVGAELQHEALLKQLILEVAGKARETLAASDAQQLEVVLPAQVVGLEALRNNPDELRSGKLTQYVLGLSDDIMREGVSFSASEDITAGIRIHMVDKEITLDLTDEAIAALLLEHLQPRFRAILEGIVK